MAEQTVTFYFVVYLWASLVFFGYLMSPSESDTVDKAKFITLISTVIPWFITIPFMATNLGAM